VTDKTSHRSLEALRNSGSTSRLLNLCAIAERHERDPDFQARPLFQAPRLNRCMILKHTLRSSERELVRTDRPVTTKIILPFSFKELKLGGVSLFVDDEYFVRQLSETLGVNANSPAFLDDLDMLQILSSLPSMDPFLMRERIHSAGRVVARCYFDLSDADAAQMRQHVAAEIQRLVSLAFANHGAAGPALSKKMAEVLLRDDTSEALEPLRQTLRLSKSEYQEAIFAWKGFLYYKWTLNGLAPKLKPVLEEILKVKVVQPTHEEMHDINQMRRRVVEGVTRLASKARTALHTYDTAFSSLIERGDAGGFRAFLLAAPKSFVEIGDTLGVLSHIVTFWRYRFAEGKRRTIDANEALDLFADFDNSVRDEPSAAAEIAA
jgi:hypothetical protein